MSWLSVGDRKAHPMAPVHSKTRKTRNSLDIYLYIDICLVHFWPKEDSFINEKFWIMFSWLSKAQAFSNEDNKTNRSYLSRFF